MLPERFQRNVGAGWIRLSHRDSGLSAVKAASDDAGAVEEASRVNADKSVGPLWCAVKRGAAFAARSLRYSRVIETGWVCG